MSGNYVRTGRQYLPSEVLPHVKPSRRNRRTIYLGGHAVRVGSLRLQCFKKSLVCARCGAKGLYFVLERHYDQELYHLNLYTRNGDTEVLMTQDHILARADGGADHIDNLQTMCAPCNTAKSSMIEQAETEEDREMLRREARRRVQRRKKRRQERQRQARKRKFHQIKEAA